MGVIIITMSRLAQGLLLRFTLVSISLRTHVPALITLHPLQGRISKGHVTYVVTTYTPSELTFQIKQEKAAYHDHPIDFDDITSTGTIPVFVGLKIRFLFKSL